MNVIMITFIYFCFDFYYFTYMTQKEMLFKDKETTYSNIYKFYLSRYKYNVLEVFEDKYINRIKLSKSEKARYLINEQSKKRPIVVFGCSYAYGQYLDKKDSFPTKLSEIAERPVYNLAYVASGIQHMFYQLKSEKVYKKIKNPEYVVYVFISDHIRRLNVGCSYSIADYIYYKVQNNELKLDTLYSYIMRLPIPFIINIDFYELFAKNNQKYTERKNLLATYLLESNKQIHKNWPDTKFIILIYYPSDEIIEITPVLEKEGIIIVTVDELLGDTKWSSNEDYKLSKNIDRFQHPSPEAWIKITPAFLKYIKKKGIDLK